MVLHPREFIWITYKKKRLDYFWHNLTLVSELPVYHTCLLIRAIVFKDRMQVFIYILEIHKIVLRHLFFAIKCDF